jgi:hypothetical protein
MNTNDWQMKGADTSCTSVVPSECPTNAESLQTQIFYIKGTFQRRFFSPVPSGSTLLRTVGHQMSPLSVLLALLFSGFAVAAGVKAPLCTYLPLKWV